MDLKNFQLNHGTVKTRILIGSFFLDEVNHISLASVFGSLPTIPLGLIFSGMGGPGKKYFW
jgi:hypothetical protein